MNLSPLSWILISSAIMSIIALSGGLTMLLKEETLKNFLLPLVAFAAGALIGGAFFHMIPVSLEQLDNNLITFGLVILGFSLFFVFEQVLHWHHCHHMDDKTKKEPVTYMILFADGLHNLLAGLAIAGIFIIDIRLGITAMLAAAAHEIPQELGEYSVLIRGGWKKSSALLFNFFSGLTFLIGGLITYFASSAIDVSFLIPFTAGNFLYIGASDLIPQVNKGVSFKENTIHFVSFLAGLALLFCTAFFMNGHAH